MKPKAHKPWEFVAVDIIYRDVEKEALTLAVVPRSVDLAEWLNAHLPASKMQPDAAMLYTYDITLHKEEV